MTDAGVNSLALIPKKEIKNVHKQNPFGINEQ